MNERSCPVCGPSAGGKVFAEANFDLARLDSNAFASRKLPEYMHYRLLRCGQCDLVYASPIPEAGFLGQAYHDATFDSVEESAMASATYARTLSRFAYSLESRQGVLDIGASDGSFVRELKRLGFSDVVGIEPCSHAIAKARADVRPHLIQGLFSRERFRPETFCLVTCCQTLEHLYDPMAFCREVFELLVPGGGAFFVAHNCRALSARLLRTKSPIFDIEHLQLFSPQSVSSMMCAAGFEGVRVSPFLNTYPLRYWLKLLPLPRRHKQSMVDAANRHRWGRIPVSLPAGNLIAFGRKPRVKTSPQGETAVGRRSWQREAYVPLT